MPFSLVMTLVVPSGSFANTSPPPEAIDAAVSSSSAVIRAASRALAQHVVGVDEANDVTRGERDAAVERCIQAEARLAHDGHGALRSQQVECRIGRAAVDREMLDVGQPLSGDARKHRGKEFFRR